MAQRKKVVRKKVTTRRAPDPAPSAPTEEEKAAAEESVNEAAREEHDPLVLPNEAKRDRMARGKPNPKPPAVEEVVAQTEEERRLLLRHRELVETGRRRPVDIKAAWKKARHAMMAIGGLTPPVEPPPGWYPN